MRGTLAFWGCLIVSVGLSHGVAVKVLPKHWQVTSPKAPDIRKSYVSHYQDFGLDYYVMRFGLFGVDREIREADVICSSSSKGLFGYDPVLLSEHLSTPEKPVKVYNLSFGFGEGFGYLAEVIKTLDLRDKVLIADLTDNTASYHLTGMAQTALQTETSLDAYKIVVERWMAYARDASLQGWLPRIRFRSDRGFMVEHTLAHAPMYRSWSNGLTRDVGAATAYYPAPGKYPFPFDSDGLVKQKFLDECARRNIRIIFTSIPYNGYDEAWGHEVAAQLGRPHVTVASDGLELFDQTHMTATGRKLFSNRLGAKLRESGLLTTELREARADGPVRR